MLLFNYFQVDENSPEKSILNLYNNSFNSNILCLKSKQKEAIKLLVKDQTDVVCMLPTGYGKSLIYELLPIAYRYETKLDAFVLVIEPLNIIIDQQLAKLGKNTSICLKNKMNDIDIDKIASGSFSYIFSHPENIIGNKAVYQALRSCNKKSFIVVDEAHCILDWGEEFRPIFKEIKQLRAVVPDAQVLALSATLSKEGQRSVAQHLLMTQYNSIVTIPTKENIRLIVKNRPGVGKYKSVKKAYDYVFESVFYELKRKPQDYPLTLIYCCGNMDWVGYGFELAERILRDSMYGGDGQKSADNLRVVMFHSALEKGNEVNIVSKLYIQFHIFKIENKL